MTTHSATHPPSVPAAPAGPLPSSLPNEPYVHGYSGRETRRLTDQADTLAALLLEGTRYPPGSRVLEAGCAVGAQTGHLAASSPGARIVAVDLDADSLAAARSRLTGSGSLSDADADTGAEVGVDRAVVEWQQADLRRLPFPDGSFDHVFVCFVLEHLADPVQVLAGLRRVLRPGGTVTVIEGDHGSAFFHPAGAWADAAIGHQVRLQAAAGGDALIGRRVAPLLTAAGFTAVEARPRTVYADATRPALVEGFTRQTFIAMIAGVRDEAVAAGLATAADFDRGLAELRRTATGDGTFHYTFVKATAVAP